MTKKVRMVDLARELGVTTVTVSNALNNRSGVSEELRQKILDKARVMGYTRLRTQHETHHRKKLRLGVIVPAYFLSEQNAFYWAFFQAITQEAEIRDMSVAMEQLESYTIRHMILPDLVTHRDCDLLIFLGPPGKQYLDMVLRSVRQPCVCLDCSSTLKSIPSVVSANYYGMAEMTEYLIKAGHTRIGFLGTVGSTEAIMDRYLGYRRALATHNLSFHDDWQIDDRKIQDGKVIIELPDHLPDAIVCNSDGSAAVLIEILQTKGLQIPEDISIVSYDGYLPASETLPLTTMAVNFDEMARSAILALSRIYEKKEPGQWRFVIPGTLIEGQSVRQTSKQSHRSGSTIKRSSSRSIESAALR